MNNNPKISQRSDLKFVNIDETRNLIKNFLHFNMNNKEQTSWLFNKFF